MTATALLGVGGAPGGGELLLVLLAALLLFGSRRLPGLARSLGQAIAAMRRAAEDVRDELLFAEPEAEDSEPESDDRGREHEHDRERETP